MQDANTLLLRQIAGKFLTKVFYCGADAFGKIHVYTFERAAYKSLSLAARDSTLVNIVYRPKHAFKQASLEAMLNQFEHHTIVTDPTAVIERSKALVQLAKQVRSTLGADLQGCYFDSENRRIHIRLNNDNLNLTTISADLQNLLQSSLQPLAQDFSCKLLLSKQAPQQGHFTPIDNASIKQVRQKSQASWFSKLRFPLLVASCLGLGLAPLAKAAPAVSMPNIWLNADAGIFHSERNSGRSGELGVGIAAPLAYDMGIQGQATAGSMDHHNFNALEGLLFWRNPVQGSAGLHLAWDRTQDISQTFAGVKGEIYDRSFTYGAEIGSAKDTDDKGRFYGQALVRWYTTPDVKLQASYTHVQSDNLADVGVEYQLNLTTLNGLSIFADAGVGDHDYSYGLVGIKYYFGAKKPLICRHRYDMIPTSLDLLPVRQLQTHNPHRAAPPRNPYL